MAVISGEPNSSTVLSGHAPGLLEVALIVVGYGCASEDLAYLDEIAPWFGDSIFVDNGPKRHELKGTAWKTLVSPGNVGFGAAANAGAARARSNFLLFLNPDVRVDRATVQRLLSACRDDSLVAGVGPRLGHENSVYESNAGGAEKNLANAMVFALAPATVLPSRQIWRSHFPETPALVDLDWVSGACFLIRREIFTSLGGFPPIHFLYEEDVALGQAAREHGHRVCVATDCAVSHRVGGSQGGDEYFKRWALGNQRSVCLAEPSAARAFATLILICIGLARRVGWRSFLGHSAPHRYLRWSLHYLLRYRLAPPADGAELP